MRHRRIPPGHQRNTAIHAVAAHLPPRVGDQSAEFTKRTNTMNRTGHVCLMATYNKWMNANIYDTAQSLSDEELSVNRKAYFGSILGTLNHLMVGDVLWLKRFAEHPANHSALEPIRQLPAPKSLDQLTFSNIRELSAHRLWLDGVIVEWSRSMTEENLDHTLSYTSMAGAPSDKSFYGLVMHFFNHQTHHRGQVTTLLSQAGVDMGNTDLVYLIPSEPGTH
jgi:uncharacterized damage-inducible protein DinB